jgi:hypothetical protein
MAKKKKVDVEVQVNDTHVELHKDENKQELIIDSKNLDIEVSKTADQVEVKVDSQSGLLNTLGKLIGKVALKRFK